MPLLPLNVRIKFTVVDVVLEVYNLSVVNKLPSVKEPSLSKVVPVHTVKTYKGSSVLTPLILYLWKCVGLPSHPRPL